MGKAINILEHLQEARRNVLHEQSGLLVKGEIKGNCNFYHLEAVLTGIDLSIAALLRDDNTRINNKAKKVNLYLKKAGY